MARKPKKAGPAHPFVDCVKHMEGRVQGIKKTLDAHIVTEEAKWAAIESKLDAILNVRVNGTQGLELGLRAIHDKVIQHGKDIGELRAEVGGLKEATAPARAWEGLRKSWADVRNASPVFHIMRTRFAKLVAGLVGLIIINSILHAMGVSLDIGAILGWLFKYIGGGV